MLRLFLAPGVLDEAVELAVCGEAIRDDGEVPSAALSRPSRVCRGGGC
jgi:hypothetical protein